MSKCIYYAGGVALEAIKIHRSAICVVEDESESSVGLAAMSSLVNS